MTKTQTKEIRASIIETLGEIRRINEAAGHTVFNPAAREGLLAALNTLEEAR